MKKMVQWRVVVTVLLLVFFLLGCQGLQVKLPDTPIGRANLFTATYRDSVEGYRIAASSPNLLQPQKENLQKQREALIEAYQPLSVYDEYASTGQVPTSAMELAVMTGLSRIEQWALEQIGSQALPNKDLTDEEIKERLKEANADTGLFGLQAQAVDPAVIAMLFQLAREGLAFFFNLMEQTRLTETELLQQFYDNYGWLKSFNPNALPVVPL